MGKYPIPTVSAPDNQVLDAWMRGDSIDAVEHDCDSDCCDHDHGDDCDEDSCEHDPSDCDCCNHSCDSECFEACDHGNCCDDCHTHDEDCCSHECDSDCCAHEHDDDCCSHSAWDCRCACPLNGPVGSTGSQGATDGCTVDGKEDICPHGHPSWVRYLGIA